jgi:hypothetical protein
MPATNRPGTEVLNKDAAVFGPPPPTWNAPARPCPSSEERWAGPGARMHAHRLPMHAVAPGADASEGQKPRPRVGKENAGGAEAKCAQLAGAICDYDTRMHLNRAVLPFAGRAANHRAWP